MKNYSVNSIITSITLPDPKENLITWAENLSNAFKANLTLYSALMPNQSTISNFSTGNESNKRFKSALMQLLDLGANLKKAHKVKYTLELSSHSSDLLKQFNNDNFNLLISAIPDLKKIRFAHLIPLMYKSKCPALFVREDMPLNQLAKILVPVRLKDGLEQKLPAVAAFAKQFGSTICLSTFLEDSMSNNAKLRTLKLTEKMVRYLTDEGLKVETETVSGFHFGTTMITRSKIIGADLVVIAIEPSNFADRFFNRMVGPHFLKNSNIPVLSIPISQLSRA